MGKESYFCHSTKVFREKKAGPGSSTCTPAGALGPTPEGRGELDRTRLWGAWFTGGHELMGITFIINVTNWQVFFKNKMSVTH